MKRITKHIITITVYILVILYFLSSCSRREIKPNQNKVCNKFDETVSERVERYFITRLPETNGGVSKVTVGDLISEGLITLDDLEGIGTSCSGEAYVSKMGDRYYYYNNISCGICSIDNMYTAWSDWTETLPDFGGKKYQVMTSILYNYSSSDIKWTDWSEWGESEDKIKAPTIPAGVEIVNTETQNKNLYRSRQATYQWYKLSSNVEYYNNGNYSETAPSGYERVPGSKHYNRTTAKEYSTVAELRQKENVKSDDTIITITKYKTKTSKYIYSHTTPATEVDDTNNCKTWATEYACYKSTTSGPYESSSVYTSSDAAMAACNQVANAINCSVTSSTSTSCPSGYTPSGTSCTKEYKGNQKNHPNRTVVDRTQEECSGGKITCLIDDTVPSTMTWPMYQWSGGKCFLTSSCWVEFVCNDGDTKIDRMMCLSTTSSTTTTTYKYTYNVGTTEYLNGGNTYYETCPSGYTRDTSKMNPNPSCKEWKKITIPAKTTYLTMSGNEVTSRDEADYLSDAEFNVLKKNKPALASYTKTTWRKDFVGTEILDKCPSGSSCEEVKTYKATIYDYKWFKSGISTKTYCNNKAYSATSPASGCLKEESSAKYGSWSDWGDKEIKKADGIEVETKKLIRYRKSYISSKELALKEWYPYEEFEEKTGKKIEDLRKDKNINVQEKVVYRYRIKK